MTGDDIRRSGFDRRSLNNANRKKSLYSGPERRSGKDRRIWIDRIQEINMKIK